MKLAVTYSSFEQMDHENYKNISKTRIFDWSCSIYDIDAWVKSVSGNKHGWMHATISEVDEGYSP